MMNECTITVTPVTAQVCVTCLITDIEMLSISEYKLEGAYEHLTGHPVYDISNLKHKLCKECMEKFKNFEKFRDQCLSARALLMDLVVQDDLKNKLDTDPLGLQADSIKAEPPDSQELNAADPGAEMEMEGELLNDDKVLMSSKCRVLLTRLSRTQELTPATQAHPKCEYVLLQCTACGDDFCDEREYSEHECVTPSTSRASVAISPVVSPLCSSLTNADHLNYYPDNDEVAVKCELQFEVQIDSDTQIIGTNSVNYHGTDSEELPKSESIEPARFNDNSNISDNKSYNNILNLHSGEHLFTCDGCHQQFKRKSDLIKHIISFSKDKSLHCSDQPFACKLCQYKCNSDSGLAIHMNAHTEETPLAFSNTLSKHMRTHTGEKPFACQLCQYKCRRSSHLVVHMRTHTEEKPFACNLCQYKAKCNSSLVIHMRTHTGHKPFACKLCEYKSISRNSLKCHMKTHTDEKPFACKLCQYKCKRKSHLVIHMRTHTGEKRFACTLCEFKCNQRSRLLAHMVTHAGEKPFACKLCEYKCKTKSNLEVHMITHTGQKPFACKLCEYKSTNRSTLTCHMKTHTDEKPFACKLCEYRCKRNSHLVIHMRTHTGEKSFACNFCDYKCRENCNLLQHMRIHSSKN